MHATTTVKLTNNNKNTFSYCKKTIFASYFEIDIYHSPLV